MRIQVALTLPRDAASVPLARHTVTAALERAGVIDDCVAEVEVALSEACTNAYLHAHDAVDFEVLVDIGDDTLTVDVVDSGAGFTERAETMTMPCPSSDSGRGMALMAAFADQAMFDSVTGDGGAVHLVKFLRWAHDAPFRKATRAHRRQDGSPTSNITPIGTHPSRRH